MKAKVFKKIIAMLFVFTLAISGVSFLTINNIAVAQGQTINYVSLGDSIPAGYGLEDFDANNKWRFAEGSYTAMFKDILIEKYGESNVVANSYAVSGYTSGDLLSFLKYDGGDKLPDSEDGAAEHNALVDKALEAQEAIVNADVITVCIGANDVLRLTNDVTSVVAAITGGTIFGFDAFDQAVVGFSNNFEQLLARLNALNSNAKVIFNNIYNPFREVEALDEDFSCSASYILSLPIEKANMLNIKNVTETYVSKTDYVEGVDTAKSINCRMAESVANYSNYQLLDVAAAFNAISAQDYANYMQGDLASLDGGTYDFSGGMPTEFIAAIDPHPTYLGHETLYGLLKDSCDLTNKLSVTFNYNGGSLNGDTSASVQVAQGACVAQPQELPTKQGLTFAGWFKDVECTDPFDFNVAINHNTTIYAGWKYILTLDANGGVFGTSSDEIRRFDILEGRGVLKAQLESQIPSKTGLIFAGWYTKPTSDDSFDSLADKVEEITLMSQDSTLYANWHCRVDLNYNNGTYDNAQSRTEFVFEGLAFVQPSADKNPTRDLYIFTGWSTSINGEEYQFGQVLSANLNLYAIWEYNASVVTFVTNGGSWADENFSGVIEVEKGKSVAKPEIGLDKYQHEFSAWYSDENCTQLYAFGTPVNEDITLYAKWTQTIFTVILNYNGKNFNGATSLTLDVERGKRVEITNEPKVDGWFFAGWYSDSDATTSQLNLDKKVEELVKQLTDNTIYAKWTPGVIVTMIDESGIEVFKETVIKDSKFSDLKKPKKPDYLLCGVFHDEQFINEVNKNYTFTESEIKLYVKWTTINCENKDDLNQKYFSPTFKPIIWTIEAKTNSNILWYVGDKQADPTAITFINTSGILGVSKFEFVPEKVGNYVISCEIDGSKISYRDSIKLSGIKPTQLDMSIVKIENRNTYTITVDFGKYYDVNKLIWYKTKDTLSDEFDEEIGRGTLLEKTFTSDCKIVVMYMEDNNDANPIISESIVITVDKYVNTETIIAILVVACIVALIVLSVIAYKKRYNDYY